jgi:cell division protein FtsB
MKVWNVEFKTCMKKKGKEAIMFCRLTGVILVISVLVFSFSAYGQENSREQIKGLDEQVQEIKADVLSIAEQLNQLEEKLLYPSNTQVAVFVSLAGDETFRLDAVEIELDGKPVAHHIYTFKELEALQKGGVQRIYTGNILAGSHELQVLVLGKSGGGNDFQKTELFTINKDVGPKIVEISLDPQSITFTDR